MGLVEAFNKSSVVVCSRGLPLVVPMRYQIPGIIVGPRSTTLKICVSTQSSELEAERYKKAESVHNHATKQTRADKRWWGGGLRGS